MSVHYKFKSNLDHDTVTFDGLSISVADLKKAIMQQKKIGKSSDFDLQITNAQTKEVYDSDDMLVPKNTSVIVARVPVVSGNKKNWDKPDLPLPIDDDDLGQIRYDRIVKSADLVNANTTEEDKVKAMITQSSQEYDPSKYVKSRSMTGPLPPTYTCYRCGKQGHWIKNCPTNNPDVKRSTGIPRSFMVPVDGPEHKGALLTSSGDYAVPLIDHQAYKEVKKEKPPFVPQDEPNPEPEAQIPEELLCMVCKDLLQDAVLIPCCGNSFCDECVRQVLLESDNHECPVCLESEVSPNTLIPNRFLRTAVLNFKNETGYTRVKKISLVKSSPPPPPVENVESPQPSPDSTVENQPQNAEGSSSQNDKLQTSEEKIIKSPLIPEDKNESASLDAGTSDPVVSPKPSLDEDSEDVQPGTPLADEPPVDLVHQPLPIQAIGQEQYQSYDYHSGSQYSRSCRDDYQDHYRDESLVSSEPKSLDSSEPKPISTIETITNIRKSKFAGRPAPVRQQFPSQRPHREERPDGYVRDRDDYHSRYDRRHHTERNTMRSGHHSRYERSSPQSRYHSDDYHHTDEHLDSHYDMEYENHVHEEEPSRRHADRYHIAPHPVSIPPSVPIYPVATLPVPPVIPAPQVFAPQPPPPGASPVDTSHVAAQPPPPGVGPLLPPNVSSDPPSFNKQFEDTHKDAKKIDDRSIDDKMEAFQRELEKRDREYSRDRDSRSRSRSSDRERSRSSRSRSYSSSKSWSRSPSRSTTRSSRSRTRTPLSSRSRSRSYTPSRSRSWSKPRSYTRSRSRTRTESSRSRSRSRTESRFRRRVDSRDRIRSPRPRTRSRSYSPKSYRHPPHRSVPYAGRHSYTPPHYGTSYQSQYGPPPAVNIPVLRPDYPPHHLHSIHPAAQSLHSRPVEHYPIDRQPNRQPPVYNDMYPMYDMYPHQRYDREQRPTRYDKRQDYQKDYPRQHPEVIAHRIPGYIGDRSRDYKPRYRQPREPRKEIIRELPQVSEQEIRIVHTKETIDDPSLRKKEEKSIAKHKKHHHHHKNKEPKKQESKIPVVIGAEQQPETPHNLIKVQVQSEVADSKSNSESATKIVKNPEKVKEKKHKHKKHKVGEQTIKKKKSAKKEKTDGVQSADSDLHVKVKTKKKKNKLKANENGSNEVCEMEEKIELPAPVIDSKPDNEDAAITENKVPEENAAKSQDTSADTLDIFADEGESAILTSETIPECDSNEVENGAVENDENAIENADDNINSEDEAEENVEEEAALHVDVPGLSKWERMDLEEDVESRPVRRSAVVVPKEEKGSLSSDIIQRAELAILSKPLKPQIASKDKSDSKNSSVASSPEAPSQHKEPELKSVVTSERLSSPSLQVTISTIKEKRSVHSRKDEKNKESSQNQQPKRIKLDRSNYSSKIDEHRIVNSSSNKASDRMRDMRDRNADRHDRRRSPPRDVNSKKRALSRERRDRDYNSRRTERERDIRYSDERLKEERRHRFAEDKYIHNSREFSNSREISRTDRRRPLNDAPAQLRNTRHYDREYVQPIERLRRTGNTRRSRSRSYDSIGSHNSLRRKEHVRQRNEQIEEPHHQRSIRDHSQSDASESRPRRKYSPIKAPEKHSTESDRGKRTKRDFHDDLKFEPDYDAYSDVEEKGSRERSKRKSTSPDTSKKRSRLEKMPAESSVKDLQKADKSSSASSSVVSESDSSDSDDQKSSKNRVSDSDHKQKHKKSKHKKHKKHKHKHKKKKSHKSKRE